MTAANSKGTPASPVEAIGRAAVVAVCLAVAIGVLLIASSLINHGHGILGISETFSLSILTPLIAASTVAGVGLLWKAMSGTLSGRPEEPSDDCVAAVVLRQKRELDPEEWFAVLEDAKREFYIAGHSMGLWCSASNRKRFTEELRRVLGAPGDVTLVMLAPTSPQLGLLQKSTGTDYSDRIAHSQRVLRELQGTLEESQLMRLRIRMVKGHAPIPYMVVGNERRLLTATYLARTDSEAMPCLELQRDSGAGRAIYDDFHKLADEYGPDPST